MYCHRIGLRFRNRHYHPREFLETFKRGKGMVAQPRNACDKARTHLQRSCARRARMGVLASMLEFVVILGTHQTGLPDESVKSIRLHLMSDWDGTRGNNRLAAQPLGHPAFPFIADCRDGAAAELPQPAAVAALPSSLFSAMHATPPNAGSTSMTIVPQALWVSQRSFRLSYSRWTGKSTSGRRCARPCRPAHCRNGVTVSPLRSASSVGSATSPPSASPARICTRVTLATPV